MIDMNENLTSDISSPISIERIMDMIPHRYPLLLIDKITSLVSHKSATGIKNVTYNENYFQGHFPVRPVMPGVLIIESMAQTAALLVVHSLGEEAEGKLVYFMSIDGARFRKPVIPGDQMTIHVTKQHKHGKVWKFLCEATVDGTLVAEAKIAAMIMDRE